MRRIRAAWLAALCVGVGGCPRDDSQVKPQPEITAPEPGTIASSGDVLTFVGNAARAGDTDVGVFWLVDGEPVCGGGSTTGAFCIKEDRRAICTDEAVEPGTTVRCDWTMTPGTHTVALHASRRSDGHINGTGYDQITVTDGVEGRPEIDFIQGSLPVTYPDRPVELQALVDNLDHELSTAGVQWSTQTGSALPVHPVNVTASTDGHAYVTATTYLPEGTTRVDLTVTNANGEAGIGSQHLPATLAANTPPDCWFRGWRDDELGTPMEWKSVRIDAEDDRETMDELAFHLESDLDGILLDQVGRTDWWGVGATVQFSAGAHLLTLTVTDADGATCVEAVEHVVLGDPEVLYAEVLEGMPVADEEAATLAIQLGVDGIDPQSLEVQLEATPYSTTYAISDRVGLDADGRAELPFIARDGVWTLRVFYRADFLTYLPFAVIDLDGDFNTPPTPPVLALSAATAITPDDLLVTASGSTDADAYPRELSYRYTWTVDDDPTPIATTAGLSSSETRKGHTYTVTVDAWDGAHASVASTAAVVVENAAPTVSSVYVSDSSPRVTATVTCGVSAHDVDGDAFTEDFAWTADGVVLGTTDTLDLSTTGLSAGTGLTCTATLTDSDGAVSVGTATATIANTPPSISSVTLSPSDPGTDDFVTATVVASDVNGDDLSTTYNWLVNGTSVQSGASDSLSGSHFDKGDRVSVGVTVSDGTDSVVSLSGSLTVGNTAPEAPTLVVTPVEPDKGDALVCEIDDAAVDPDGDTVTYAMSWTVDGVDYSTLVGSADTGLVDTGAAGGLEGPSTTTWSGDTVAAGDADWGEVWTCTATPSDGTDFGTAATAEVEVACAPGSASDCTEESCAALLAKDPDLPDGTYWIAPDGVSFEVDCDMTTDGGGWTGLTFEDAYSALDVTISELEAAPTYSVDPVSGPSTLDAGGDHSYRMDVDFPPGFSELYFGSDFTIQANAASGGMADIYPSEFIQSAWGTTYQCSAVICSTEDVAFGDADAAGPATSLAETAGATVYYADGTRIAWPAGTASTALGSAATTLRVEWGAGGGQAEGWAPWAAGTIYVR